MNARTPRIGWAHVRPEPGTIGADLESALIALFLSVLAAMAGSPNLVVITLDTLRADHLGVYGHTPSPSPRLDALAARSLVFEDASTVAPLTLPAHTTLFTGLEPREHGLLSNADVIAPTAPLVIDTLETRGYHSAAFVSGAPVSRGSGLEHHFQVFDDDRPDDLGGPRYPPERRGAATAARAAAWVAETPEPFVLWVHLFDAHAPYTPLEEHADLAPYDAEIAALDAAVGSVLDALSARGVDEHTAVLVAGDHGEALGAHDELTHGVLLYQETVRVPLILSAPGSVPERVAAPVSLVDVTPTLLALAGSDEALPGIDLREAAEHPDRTLVALTEHGAERYNWSPLLAVRQGSWKYIEAPRPELYDLSTDPHEQHNLIDERPDVAARLGRAAAEAGPDATRIAQLRALGYVVGSEAPTGPDPKDRAHLLAPMEEATVALYDERFADARRLMMPVVKEDPDNPVAWNDLGLALIGLGRYEKAAEAFKSAVAASPRDAALWNNLGLAHSRAGNEEGARRAYAEAARMWPTFAAPCVNLAVMYWREGNMDAARRWASEALNREPDIPEAQDVLQRTN